MNRTILTVTGVLSASSLLLVDSAVKGTVLLALAAVVALILRRDSAATRHLVWLLAIVAMLVVPVLSATLPQWRVLPAWMSSTRPAVAEVGSPAIVRPADVAVELPQASALVEVERPSATVFQPATELPDPRPAVVAPAEVPAPMVRSWNWINALPLVWAIGFAVLMLRLSAARWMLWSSERLATVICGRVAPQLAFESRSDSATAHDPIVTAMKAICLQLGIGRPVTLLIHPDKTIPVVWGIFRCRLMLPAAARQWSDEQLQSVLLHELAHIKRRDTLVQLLAQVACALHWFNPLVWFAAWRLDVERERSCDDLVLASGIRPSAYAGHLLDVVTGLSPARWTQACGLAMARKSSLEARLTAVLGKDLNRRGVSVALAGLALAIAVGVAVPIAMLCAAVPDKPNGEALDENAEPKDDESKALFEMWKTNARSDGKIPGGRIGQMAASLKNIIDLNPGTAAAAKCEAVLKKCDATRDWAPAEAAGLLDEITVIIPSRAGLEVRTNRERQIHSGKALPAELKDAPWGSPEAQGAQLETSSVALRGLRMAWLLEPIADKHSLGSVLKSRVLFHNTGRATVCFATDEWVFGDGHEATDSNGEQIDVWTAGGLGISARKIVRLAPGEYAEAEGAPVGVGSHETSAEASSDKVGCWIEAKEGDTVTFTPRKLRLTFLRSWRNNKGPQNSDSALQEIIAARVMQESPMPAAATDREQLLRRVMQDLTGAAPTAKEIATFVADNTPDALAKLTKSLQTRVGAMHFAGELAGGETKFRVTAAAANEKPKQGAAAAPAPKHKDARALYEVWQRYARANGDIPGALVGELAAAVKTFIKYNPTWETVPKLNEIQPRLDATHDWKAADAIALLDEVAAIQDSPLKVAAEKATRSTIRKGEALPKKFADVPWGDAQPNGLRAAWVLEPIAAEHRIGAALKARLLVWNSGAVSVSLQVPTFHQGGMKARDAKDAEVQVSGISWTTRALLVSVRLAPGEYIEIRTPGVGIGPRAGMGPWAGPRVGSNVLAKAGDELTLTHGLVPLDGSEVGVSEDDPHVSGPGWWLAHIKARLNRELPLPADAAERTRLLDRAVRELFATAPTAEETAEFIADKTPDALDALAKRLVARVDVVSFSGKLPTAPAKFRVLAADENADKQPRVVLGPGEYPLPSVSAERGNATLKIVGRPVGERRTNDAQLLFEATEFTGVLPPDPHKLEVPDGWGTWAIVCRPDSGVLYLLSKGAVRKIDYTKPRNVTDTPANDLPAEFRDEVKRQLEIAGVSAEQQAVVFEKPAPPAATPEAEKPKGAAAKLTLDALLGFWRGTMYGKDLTLSFHRPPVEKNVQLDIYFGRATIGRLARFNIAPDGDSALVVLEGGDNAALGTLRPIDANTMRLEGADKEGKAAAFAMLTRDVEPPATEPRQKETRELFEMWKRTANEDGTIPGTFIGQLATEVRAHVIANPNSDSGMKLPKLLPRFVTSRDWTQAEAIKLLDDLAYYSTQPIVARVAKAKLPSGPLWRTEVEFADIPVKISKWSEAKDGLRVGMRVVDADWRIGLGGGARVELWLHNAGDKDVTFKTTGPDRQDTGVAVAAIDAEGREHWADGVNVLIYAGPMDCKLPAGHVALAKKFEVTFAEPGSHEKTWLTPRFHGLKHGKYQLRCKWMDAYPDISKPGEWKGELTAPDHAFTLAAAVTAADLEAKPAPKLAKLPVAAAAPQAAETPKTTEQEAFTAWGKEISGLQAGLGFKAGEKRAYRHGETTNIVLRVRNVGTEEVEFKHIWAFFVENPPSITDADGKPVQLPKYKAQGQHGPRSPKVAPGKEVELYEWKLDLRLSAPRLGRNIKFSTLYGTGKFSVQCERIVGRTSSNSQDPNPAFKDLATGKLELEVKEDLTAWGKEVGGLQAGLGFKAGGKRAYTHGETATLVVRVRNVGKEEVKFEYLRPFFYENSPTVTDGEGKPVSLGGISIQLVKRHIPVEVNLAAGKEIELFELKLEISSGTGLGIRMFPTIFGTGKFQFQYEKVLGDTSSGTIKLDPTLSKLATGKLELEIKPVALVQPEAPKPKQGVQLERAMLEGTWAGEKDGVKVDLKFLWLSKDQQVWWKLQTEDEAIGARMSVVMEPDGSAAKIVLNKGMEFEATVGRVTLGERGSLRLELLPPNPNPNETKYPAVKDLVLTRQPNAEKQKPAGGALLKPATEKKLKWGEPVNGLRMALAWPPTLGEAAMGDAEEFYLVVQNVSQAAVRLTTGTAAPNPRRLNLMRRLNPNDETILSSRTVDDVPVPGDWLLQPRESALIRLIHSDEKMKDGQTFSAVKEHIVSVQPQYSYTADMTIEKAPAGAWTGKLTTGETRGSADVPPPKSGVPLAEQTWPMPPWGAEKDGLSAGIRIIGEARIGGEVKAELWVRNSGAKDVTFSHCSRADFGLHVVSQDKDGKEHSADVTQFRGYPVLTRLLLPAGNIVKLKEFTIKLGAKKDGERVNLDLPPGEYKLRAVWSDTTSRVAPEGEWTGKLTTGEVDFKLAAAKAGADVGKPAAKPPGENIVTVPDERYVKSGFPKDELVGEGVMWNDVQNGLSLGYRITGDEWRILGKEVKVELWVRNPGDKDVKFQSLARPDIGLRMKLKDETGVKGAKEFEHESNIARSTSLAVAEHRLLPPGHAFKVKEFTVSLLWPENDVSGIKGHFFAIAPGAYKFHCELELPGFSAKGEGDKQLTPAAGEWTGKLTTRHTYVMVIAPDAPAPKPRVEHMDVDISKDGEVSLFRIRMPLEELKTRAAKNAKKWFTIRADKDVPYAKVVEVVEALKAVGVTEFSFAEARVGDGKYRVANRTSANKLDDKHGFSMCRPSDYPQWFTVSWPEDGERPACWLRTYPNVSKQTEGKWAVVWEPGTNVLWWVDDSDVGKMTVTDPAHVIVDREGRTNNFSRDFGLPEEVKTEFRRLGFVIGRDKTPGLETTIGGNTGGQSIVSAEFGAWSITGTVTDADGKPLADVSVRLTTNQVLKTEKTNAKGEYYAAFSLPLQLLAHWRGVTVEPMLEGFTERDMAKSCEFNVLLRAGEQPQRVHIAGDKDFQPGPIPRFAERDLLPSQRGASPGKPGRADFVMLKAGEITGELVTADGKPAPPHWVAASTSEQRPGHNAAIQLSDDKGHFRLKGIPTNKPIIFTVNPDGKPGETSKSSGQKFEQAREHKLRIFLPAEGSGKGPVKIERRADPEGGAALKPDANAAVRVVDGAAQELRKSPPYNFRDSDRYRALDESSRSRLKTVVDDLAQLERALVSFMKDDDNGTPPKTLEQLVPKYIDRLPEDPFASPDEKIPDDLKHYQRSLDGRGYLYLHKPGGGTITSYNQLTLKPSPGAWQIQSVGLRTFPLRYEKSNPGLIHTRGYWGRLQLDVF